MRSTRESSQRRSTASSRAALGGAMTLMLRGSPNAGGGRLCPGQPVEDRA